MSVLLLEEGFRTSLPLRVRYDDGGCEPLRTARWKGRARGADAGLLERATGPTLDIGCGPGRLVAALARSGVRALGIDIAASAVELARRAGAPALQLSVFDDVPGAGSWQVAVLADGNIGIGGDPVRLLRRTTELLAADGRVLVELQAPGAVSRSHLVRLEDHAGRTGSWFPWAVLGVDAVAGAAGEAGLRVVEVWSAADGDGGDDRWFAALQAA